MKILIGIPAFNEEKVIGQVIKSLPKKINKFNVDVFVLDDGSTDQTASIAKKTGAVVARHLLNRGLGGALKTIFDYAKNHRYELLVTMDADGQHDSRDLKHLINPILNKKVDAVIGSRWLAPKNAPWSRLIINKLANLLTYAFFGTVTSDSQSGFRAFNRKSIEEIELKTDGMEVSSEIFREISRTGLKFKEIPIKVIYSQYSQTKGQKLENAPDVFIQLLIRLLR